MVKFRKRSSTHIHFEKGQFMTKSKAFPYQHKLNKFYELTGIPLCLCTSDTTACFEMPAQSVIAQLSDILARMLTTFHSDNHNPDTPMVTITPLGSFFGIAQLDTDIYLFIGPVASISLTHKEIYATYSELLTAEQLSGFADLMIASPVYTYRRFLCAFSLLIELCTNQHISYKEMTLSNYPLKSELSLSFKQSDFLDYDHSIRYEDILQYEKDLCEAVTAGNPQLLKECFTAPTHNPVGQISNHSITNEKYSFIALISLVIRAAIRGGMPHNAAFSLGDLYCRQLEALPSAGNIYALSYKMVEDFCIHVEKYKTNIRLSPIIRKCQNYVSEHLHETIRMEDLAKLCNVSTRSISSHFKKDLGMTVPTYINREKLQESSFLLTHSSYSIAEISNLMRFSSQSYFTRIFRNFYGCTPQQYRQTNKNS
jgi:AraC-like DNA-binding protein